MHHPEPIQKDITFEAVFDAYYDRIYKYAYMLLLNREEAEDVTADTFLAAYESFGRYDKSRAAVATWLTRIAHNRAVNLMRSAAYRTRTALPEDRAAPAAEDAADRVDASVTVLWLYDRLKPEERELLNMRYVMELKDREIASLLGLPEKTVNKRFQRLLVKCRMLLNSGEAR